MCREVYWRPKMEAEWPSGCYWRNWSDRRWLSWFQWRRPSSWWRNRISETGPTSARKWWTASGCWSKWRFRNRPPNDFYSSRNSRLWTCSMAKGRRTSNPWRPSMSCSMKPRLRAVDWGSSGSWNPNWRSGTWRSPSNWMVWLVAAAGATQSWPWRCYLTFSTDGVD